MTLIFRPAVAGDLPALLTLYRDLSPDDLLPDGADAATVWQDLLARRETIRMVIGEEAGQAVSTCMLILVPNLTRGGRSFAIIENVVTSAACRGQGIGTAMMQFALDTAWQAGCYKVMLSTGRTDEAVLRFYEKAGFARGGKTFFEARR